jgi:hypothetical protein
LGFALLCFAAFDVTPMRSGLILSIPFVFVPSLHQPINRGGCVLQIVRDSSDLMRLIYQGNAVRRVAATKMNDQSSRSHSVFTIKIEQKTVTELADGLTREQIIKAKVNLVDLAGSERAAKTGASGATLKEGANINLSLMALGNVINMLSEGAARYEQV